MSASSESPIGVGGSEQGRRGETEADGGSGVTQVTYKRDPLYYLSGCCGYGPGDKKPGDARGQGVFQLWYVLSPKGTPIRT